MQRVMEIRYNRELNKNPEYRVYAFIYQTIYVRVHVHEVPNFFYTCRYHIVRTIMQAMPDSSPIDICLALSKTSLHFSRELPSASYRSLSLSARLFYDLQAVSFREHLLLESEQEGAAPGLGVSYVRNHNLIKNARR